MGNLDRLTQDLLGGIRQVMRLLRMPRGHLRRRHKTVQRPRNIPMKINIENDKVIASSPQGHSAEIPLADFLNALMGQARIDTCGMTAQPGFKAAYSQGHSTVIIQELEPHERTVRWIDAKNSRAKYGAEVVYKDYHISLPYTVFVCVFSREMGSDFTLGKHCEVFFRTEPITDCRKDELSYPTLLNTSRFVSEVDITGSTMRVPAQAVAKTGKRAIAWVRKKRIKSWEARTVSVKKTTDPKIVEIVDGLTVGEVLSVPKESLPLSWICSQFMDRTSFQTVRDQPTKMRKAIDALVACLLETGFNLSSEAHFDNGEGGSWYTNTVSAEIDDRIVSPEAWQEATRKNPHFILDVPFLRSGVTVEQIAQRCLRNLHARPGLLAAKTTNDLARIVFNHVPGQPPAPAPEIIDPFPELEVPF